MCWRLVPVTKEICDIFLFWFDNLGPGMCFYYLFFIVEFYLYSTLCSHFLLQIYILLFFFSFSFVNKDFFPCLLFTLYFYSFFSVRVIQLSILHIKDTVSTLVHFCEEFLRELFDTYKFGWQHYDICLIF